MTESSDRLDTAASSASEPLPVPWERELVERLVMAQIQEQRASRRWKLLGRLLWLALVAVAIWWFAMGDSVNSAVKTPHTAVIELRGDIEAGGAVNANDVLSSLRSAFEEPSAKAVVLLIDSPGGSPVQAGIINDEIERLKMVYPDKKLYAVVEDTCASAAYYIAAGAHEIYVDKASLVGSIGVLIDGFGFTGLMDKLGIERRLMTAGSNKGMLDPFSPQDEQQRTYVQSMLTQIHEQFISVVRKGRGDRLKETPETFSGLVWNGQQAVEMGLVDGLGSLDFVAREVIDAEEVVDYTQRESVGVRLARELGMSIGQGFHLAATKVGWKLR